MECAALTFVCNSNTHDAHQGANIVILEISTCSCTEVKDGDKTEPRRLLQLNGALVENQSCRRSSHSQNNQAEVAMSAVEPSKHVYE